MKRHYAPYFRGLAGIKEYRTKLMAGRTAEEVFETLEEIKQAFTEVGV